MAPTATSRHGAQHRSNRWSLSFVRPPIPLTILRLTCCAVKENIHADLPRTSSIELSPAPNLMLRNIGCGRLVEVEKVDPVSLSSKSGSLLGKFPFDEVVRNQVGKDNK